MGAAEHPSPEGPVSPGARPWTLLAGLLMSVAVLGAVPLRGASSAADPFAPCEEAFRADPGSRSAVRCFRRAGGDPDLAGEAVRRLEALRRRHPDNPWLPFDLAALEWARSSPRVPELYAEAARLFARRGDPEGEIDARRGRARYLTRFLGRLEEAGEELERIVALAERSGEPSLAIRARIERARWLLTAGRVEEAQRLLQEDREEVLGAGDPSGHGELDPSLRRDWVFDAARTAHELGRHRQARRLFRRWLEETPAGEAPQGEASVRVLLAGSHLSAELPTPEAREEGRRLLGEALASARAAGNGAAELQALWLLGKVMEGGEAAGRLEDCVGRARQLRERQLESLCLASLASARASETRGRGAPEEARALLEEATSRAAESESPWVLLHVQLEALRVAWATLPRELALERALALLEEMEAVLLEQVEDRELRSRLRSEWLDPRYWLSGELLAGRGAGGGPPRDDLELAFTLVEEVRARALAEALEAVGGTPPVTGPGQSAEEGPATLDRLEALLGPDEALLSFQIGYWRNMWGEPDGGGWVLVVTRRGTRVHPLPDGVTLGPEVRRLRGLEDPEAVPALWVSLHRQLLARALAGLPPEVDRLVLVPDGPLHRLPFALLRAEAGGATLGESHRLVRVPSATLWHHWRRTPPVKAGTGEVEAGAATGRSLSGNPRIGEPALVLADPDLGRSPGAERGGPSATGAGVRGAGLGPLPWARKEGEAVLSALGGGRLLTGDEATEAALVRALAPAARRGVGPWSTPPMGPVVHLAAHAVVDEVRPERSAVFLAPGGGEDGRLTAAEILELDLEGRLVVLAACDTASGEEVRGEGVLSLARYFFEAGARTVVASLWSLPDRGASRVLERFYLGLARGLSAAEALREARRWAREHGVEARAWASLVVLGDGSLTPYPEGRPGDAGAGWWTRASGWLPSSMTALAVLAVLAGALWLYRRTRRERPR